MEHRPEKVDLFLFMGQSNMAGRAAALKDAAVSDAPAPACIPGAGYEFKAVSKPDGLFPAAEPFGAEENNPEGIWEPGRKTGSAVTAFINAYYAGTGVPVVGVSASRGGSCIAQWLPGTPFLKDTIERLEKAKRYLAKQKITVRHKYLLWCQGESDGKLGTGAEEYTAAFREIWDTLQHHGLERCFLIRIGHFNHHADPNAPVQDYRTIIEAQNHLPERVPHVTMVSTGFAAMRDAGLMPDTYHYAQHAYNEIGTEAGARTARFVRGEPEKQYGNAYETPFAMERIPEPVIPDRWFSAADYPDIASAVRACGEAGGGTVSVPSGEWVSGPIRLYSGVRLHVELGAVISFKTDPKAYLPVVFTRWEGTECYNYHPLIYALDGSDIALTGQGVLKGNGRSWWGWKQSQAEGSNALYDAAAAGVPVDERIYGTESAGLRPSFVQFIRCRRVLIQDVSILDGPQWTVHPVYCQDVIVRRIHIHTTGHNTDGLNPDSCRNVLIEDSTFFTGDDCVAVNAGLNEDGWRVGIPSENIVIRRCTMTGGHGGVVIGSAISGGVNHVCAYDCDISGTMQGLRLKSMRGRGGTVENIWFRDIRIHNVSHQAVQINMFYEFSTVMPKTKVPSVFRNIHYQGICGQGACAGIELKGLPEQHLYGISMEDVNLRAATAMQSSDVDEIRFYNVNLQPI